MKTYHFSRFLKLDKSSRTNQQLGRYASFQNHKGKTVWNSAKDGTFVKAIHGELKDLK